jgi:hypothetical protein
VESLRWTVRLGLADFTLDRQFVGRHGDACRVSFDLASTVPLPVTQAKLVVWPQGFCQSVLKSRDLDGFKDGNPGYRSVSSSLGDEPVCLAHMNACPKG